MSVENPFFFTHQVEQKYVLSIHDDEVKDTCIRDLKKIIVCLGLPVKKGNLEFF